MDIVIDILALIVSIIALIISCKANKKSSDMQAGSVEMEIRSMIINAKNRFSDLSIQLNNQQDNEILKKAITAALEEVCNVYDEACMKYLDNKVDKKRFKKTYISEIKNWINSEQVKDRYLVPQTKYNATVNVYAEWHNMENR